MSLEAVIFDMDGVLTNTVEAHYLTWKQALGEAGISFTRKENEKLLGLTRRRSLEVILHHRPMPKAEFERLLERKNEIYLDLVKRMSREDLLPGVERLLGEIRAAGLRVAVASASRNTTPVLQHLGVLSYFDAIVDGNSITRSKPAPDVFLKAAERLDCQPDGCLVLEDSLSGIQAAAAAGMCVAGLGLAERLSPADAVFPDLSNVHLTDLYAIHQGWMNRRLQKAHNSIHISQR